MFKQNELVSQFRFTFNHGHQFGEGFCLITKFISNGEPNGVIINQELLLSSGANSASFNLYESAFTPEILRKLADQMEQELCKARALAASDEFKFEDVSFGVNETLVSVSSLIDQNLKQVKFLTDLGFREDWAHEEQGAGGRTLLKSFENKAQAVEFLKKIGVKVYGSYLPGKWIKQIISS